MKVHGKRSLALATVAALLATSVVSTFSALAATGDELTDAGYGKADGLNVHLADNEYYKEIFSFDTGSKWVEHDYTSPDATVASDTTNKNSGSAAVKVIHGKDTSPKLPAGTPISVINIQDGLSIASADKAKYIQFYAENASDTDIELAKFPLNGAVADAAQNADVVKNGTEFLDLKASNAAWTAAETKAATLKLDGINYEAIVIKANSKGLYRIPVAAWGNKTTITRVMFWTYGAKDTTLYLDDLGLVAVTEDVTPPAENRDPVIKLDFEDNTTNSGDSNYTFNTYDGVAKGAGTLSYVEGKVGAKAAQFTGTTFMELNQDLALGTEDYSFAFWLKDSGTPQWTYVMGTQSYGDMGQNDKGTGFIYENQWKPYFVMADGQNVIGGTYGDWALAEADKDKWVHLVFSVDRSETADGDGNYGIITAYRDGEVFATSKITANTNIDHHKFMIGGGIGSGADNEWIADNNFCLDDVRVFKCALTADEAAALADTNTPPVLDKGFLNSCRSAAEELIAREDEFTAESFAVLKAAYDKVVAMPETTQEEVEAKAYAFFDLYEIELVKKPVDEEVITEVPEGYTQEPTGNIPLTEKEYYKELSGFEKLDTDWEKHSKYVKGEIVSSADHKNSGNACVSATSKGVIPDNGVGQDNVHNVFQVKLTGDKQDFSKAKYLQFYVENTSDSDMEISKIALELGGKLKGQLQDQVLTDVTVLGAEFLDMKTTAATWKPAVMAPSSPRLDNTSMNGRFAAVVIPAGAKGMVRIPLTAWGGAGNLKAVARVQFWTFIKAGETAPATLYVDDLGLAGVLGEAASVNTQALDAAKDAASKKAEKDYTAESWAEFQAAMAIADDMPETTQSDVDAKAAAINAAIAKLVDKPIEEDQISKYTDKPSQNVYLNPGEKYKYIAGGEDNDIHKIDLTHAFTRNQVSLIEDIKNSGAKGIKIMQTSGDSQNAFHTLFVNVHEKQKDWSDAKYLTFWVENNQANEKAVLELFYIQARNEANEDLEMLAYDMTGIKFFDQRTGKWSDLEVMPNKQHRLPGEAGADGSYTMVPSLQIPAGAKGLVRIPLTNVAAEDLKTVKRFQVFMATSGATGIYYADDIGLVTYDGDTAPGYVDGEGDGTTPGGDDGDNDGDNDGPDIDWGDNDDPTFDWGDDEPGDGNDGNGDIVDDPEKTGVADLFMLAMLLLLISGAGVCALIRKKSNR